MTRCCIVLSSDAAAVVGSFSFGVGDFALEVSSCLMRYAYYVSGAKCLFWIVFLAVGLAYAAVLDLLGLA